MAFSLIASMSEGGPSSGDTWTSSGTINSSGATLLVALVTHYNLSSPPTFSDSRGNTWTSMGTATGGGDVEMRGYYVNTNAPSVGSSHGFTVTGTDVYSSVVFAAFSGSALAPLDQYDKIGTGSSTTATCAFTGITPTEDGELIIGGIAFSDSAHSGLSCDSGLTTIQSLAINADHFGVGMAWKEQATAALINPAFSWTTSNRTATLVASFKSGAPPAGGGGKPWLYYNEMMQGR